MSSLWALASEALDGRLASFKTIGSATCNGLDHQWRYVNAVQAT